MSLKSLFKKSISKKEELMAGLKGGEYLSDIDNLADQILSNEPILKYRYKDFDLYINNEVASIYHITKSTSKMEKLANTCTPTEAGVMFDVGANNGLFSYFFKIKNPTTHAFLFEADQKLIACIEKNMLKFEQYTIINKAVSDKDGEISFFINEESAQTNSIYLEAVLPFSQRDKIREVKVPSVSIDNFILQHNIASIDVFKIDIQGSEFAVLNTNPHTLNIIETALVEICFLMPDTIPLIQLMNSKFTKYEPIADIIMGADLKFYN